MTVPTQEVQNTPTEQAKTPEFNLANMRKALEAERAEKAQMKQRLDELEKLAKQNSYQKVNSDDDETDEPYVDPKTLKRKLSKFEETIDQKIAKAAEEKARAIVEEQNRINYVKQNSDFESTMQPEVIQKFADKYPGMAEAILRMPDGFERQRLVYEAIKSTGVNKPEAPKETIQQKIDANKRSPYYIPASSGTAPYNGMGDFSVSGQKNAYQKLQELKGRLRLG